jgi:hypothetical protein
MGLLEGGLVMFLVGLILFAAAVAAAIIGIVQTRHLVIDVHALGQTWTVHAYWVLVAGLIVAGVGLLGLAVINRGAERSRRLRRERRALATENRGLSKLAADNRGDIASKRAANAYPAVDVPAPDRPMPAAAASTSEPDSYHDKRRRWFTRRAPSQQST